MQGDAYAVLLHCPRCDAPYDDGDNFCRRCGASLDGSHLPAIRDSYDVVPWQASVPVLARGAAVVAAGTLAEMLLRRLIGRAFGPARSRPLAKRAAQPAASVVSQDESLPADTQLVSETLLLRRVRLRR